MSTEITYYNISVLRETGVYGGHVGGLSGPLRAVPHLRHSSGVFLLSAKVYSKHQQAPEKSNVFRGFSYVRPNTPY